MIAVVELSGDYVAHVDPLSGLGMLVMPEPLALHLRVGNTISCFDTVTWNQAMRELDALGWDLARNTDGGWIREGCTRDGSDVIALSARDPIHDDVDFGAWALTIESLRKSVDMVVE